MPVATSAPLGFEPTLAAAQARISAVRPGEYARTRNALNGAVTGLSPYLTHGLVGLVDVLQGVCAQHPLDVQHKFVFELGWRAYYRHVWAHRGSGILESLHEGLLPEDAYQTELPADIRQGRTGVPAIDLAVRTLYATGMLHNHARMWLASYVVHIRKVHWRAGADWLYAHLLDGDLASNHLSWQWVAGTGSRKPYLFNADNVARYAPEPWHSPGTAIDTSYEALDRIARQARAPGVRPGRMAQQSLEALSEEPALFTTPPPSLGVADLFADLSDPQQAAHCADAVRARDVYLVHPWNLGPLPEDLAPNTLVLGLCLADFHHAWPWSERRWRFVARRMAELTADAPPQHRCWLASAAHARAALSGARSVQSMAEPHLGEWLETLADLRQPASLFAPLDRRCDSFSNWWNRVTRGMESATDLLR